MPAPATTQALHSLVPSISASGKPLPAVLVSQSESLLALSRQRHPNLKAEEEIARAHACAEIACNRLRLQLRLPAIKHGAGAPCKPTTYKKLYKFLDTSLVDAIVGSLTPKNRKRTVDGSIKASGGSTSRTPISTIREVAGEDTPSKRGTSSRATGAKAGAGFVGTIKFDIRKNGVSDSGKSDDKAPNFVAPTVKRLCKQFATPSMAPHVFTGTCVVLGLAAMWPVEDRDHNEELDEETKSVVLGLVIALYLMVLTRMRKGKMTSDVYSRIAGKSQELVPLGEKGLQRVEEWISKLKAEGWCVGQDWWDSVPENVLVLDGQGNTVGEDANVTGQDESERIDQDDTGWTSTMRLELQKEDPEGVLLPGLGTMLHHGNDWWSEDIQLEAERWKKSILKRIGMMDRAAARNIDSVVI